jgi:hypothetical protein
MTKVALCISCSDIIAPYHHWQTDRRWRWCQCDGMAVRWRDGSRGLIEVTSLAGREYVRVIGLNNMFLEQAVGRQTPGGAWWRQLHEDCAELVEPHYLFSKENRNCWAAVVRVDETGDVTFIDYQSARREPPPGKPPADTSWLQTSGVREREASEDG